MLAYLSLTPEVNVPGGMRIWDKLSHFSAYAVLAVLMSRAVLVKSSPLTQPLFICWLVCAGYGLFLEGLQGWMALGRYFEIGDLLANALGALAGCVLFCLGTGRSSRI